MANNNFILITLTMFILTFILLIVKQKEPYTNHNMLDKEQNSSETLIQFCEKLHQLDDNEDAGVYTNEYYNNLLKTNKTQIDILKEEIETINNQIVSVDVNTINNYRSNTDKKAREQLSVIDNTLKKIQNRNNLYVNLDS
jgi:hypothetical protein